MKYEYICTIILFPLWVIEIHLVLETDELEQSPLKENNKIQIEVK